MSEFEILSCLKKSLHKSEMTKTASDDSSDDNTLADAILELTEMVENLFEEVDELEDEDGGDDEREDGKEDSEEGEENGEEEETEEGEETGVEVSEIILAGKTKERIFKNNTVTLRVANKLDDVVTQIDQYISNNSVSNIPFDSILSEPPIIAVANWCDSVGMTRAANIIDNVLKVNAESDACPNCQSGLLTDGYCSDCGFEK